MSEAITADIPLKPPVLPKVVVPKADPPKAAEVVAAPPVPVPPGALTKLFALFGFTMNRKQAVVAASAVASLLVGAVAVRTLWPTKAAPVTQVLAPDPVPPTKAPPTPEPQQVIPPTGPVVPLVNPLNEPPAPVASHGRPISPADLPPLPGASGSQPGGTHQMPRAADMPGTPSFVPPTGPRLDVERTAGGSIPPIPILPPTDNLIPPANNVVVPAGGSSASNPPPWNPNTSRVSPAAEISAPPLLPNTFVPTVVPAAGSSSGAPLVSPVPVATPNTGSGGGTVPPIPVFPPINEPRGNPPAGGMGEPNPLVPPVHASNLGPAIPPVPAGSQNSPSANLPPLPVPGVNPPSVVPPFTGPTDLAPPGGSANHGAAVPAFGAPKPLDTAPPVVNSQPKPFEPSALPAGGTRMESVKPSGGTEVQPAASARTPATSFDVDIYQPRATDTYETISRDFYNDAKYAAALKQYNRGAALNGGSIDVPPLHVLRKQSGGTAVSRESSNAAPVWGAAGSSPPAFRSTGNPVYQVPANGATLGGIAKTTLGSEQQWRRIWDLNPQVTNPSDILAPGTQLKLPADARVN